MLVKSILSHNRTSSTDRTSAWKLSEVGDYLYVGAKKGGIIADMVYVGSEMYEAGADGINFDTTAAAGDAEVYATLKAVEILKEKIERDISSINTGQYRCRK